MNLKEIHWRARQIVKKEDVRLLEATPPNYFHFEVKQRNGKWTDVWYQKIKGQMEWDCNCYENDKKGQPRGCLFKKGESKPHCSHTIACAILIKNMEAKHEN